MPSAFAITSIISVHLLSLSILYYISTNMSALLQNFFNKFYIFSDIRKGVFFIQAGDKMGKAKRFKTAKQKEVAWIEYRKYCNERKVKMLKIKFLYDKIN